MMASLKPRQHELAFTVASILLSLASFTYWTGRDSLRGTGMKKKGIKDERIKKNPTVLQFLEI